MCETRTGERVLSLILAPILSRLRGFCLFIINSNHTIEIMQNNADVVKKFIFRYLSVPLPDGIGNILVNRTYKNKFNKIIELNKFSNNVCIIRIKEVQTCCLILINLSLISFILRSVSIRTSFRSSTAFSPFVF
jgi:hypothetical protein